MMTLETRRVIFDLNGCRACCPYSRVKSLVGKFRFNLADPRSSFPPDHQTNRGPKEFGRQETIAKITTCEAIGQVQGPWAMKKLGCIEPVALFDGQGCIEPVDTCQFCQYELHHAEAVEMF